MEFDECDYCKASPSSTATNPEEDESRTGPAVFSIVIHVTFLHLPLEFYLMEEDEPDFLHFEESQIEYSKVEIECSKFTDVTTSRCVVEDLLTSIHVAFKPFMVDEILTCARRMLNDAIYSNRKVLTMDVKLSLYVDEQPLGVPMVLSDEDDDDDEEEEETSMMPASKSSIDKLERIQIQESSQLCSICLEVFSHGVEATRLPCSHLFHGGCIEQWLSKSNSCPLCRFEMN